MDVTEQDLIEAILAAQEAPGTSMGALTSEELVERTGRSRTYINKWLREQSRAGRLGVVRVKRIRIDGTPTFVPAYYLVNRS